MVSDTPGSDTPGSGRVAVLLSAYNGARFLPEQLDSLLAQTHADWVLFWRDDGSTDETPGLLRGFAAGLACGRALEIGSGDRLGPARSFYALLRAALAEGFETVAFADQDDVWLPEKLARGVRLLAASAADVPALYCARQIYVDEALRRLGVSRSVRATGFPAALTENIATGCTMMMNRAAAALVARSRPPLSSYHDWWAYLLVSAARGAVLVDEEPAVLYRQHAGNLVGAPHSALRRSIAALNRGPRVFMNVFRQQVLALAAQPHLIPPCSHQRVEAIASALRGGTVRRLLALCRMRGMRRQNWPETWLFRAWFLFG